MTQRTLPKAGEIPKYPSVRRDIAVIVADNICAQLLIDSMNALNSTIIAEIALFDIYRGKGVDNGKKSLAFRVLLQDTKKTLTDEEADLITKKLIKILEDKFGAKLRN